MNCPQCENEMIRTQATNFGDKYWYCRACKKELAELQPKTKKSVPNIVRPGDLADAYAELERLLDAAAAKTSINSKNFVVPGTLTPVTVAAPAPNGRAVSVLPNELGPCYSTLNEDVHRFSQYQPVGGDICNCGGRAW